MANVNVIPNENILNSKNNIIGDAIRLTSNSLGYTPIFANDKITIKLSTDNSQIAIGQIIIRANNFQSAALSIKTLAVNEWKFYSTLTTDRTIFDNLYATELQFQFVSSSNNANKIQNVRIGVVGCFPPAGKKQPTLVEHRSEK